jgi:hypothetical protein
MEFEPTFVDQYDCLDAEFGDHEKQGTVCFHTDGRRKKF